MLPLAAPSYVLAYAYTEPHLGRRRDPVSEVRGLWGAAFIYAVGLYPYVYLAARAAFASQSACALEAARTLGASPVQLFWRVALPLARPGIAAGGALALMEIAADYGAAQHFGLTTLSTAIFRAWYAHGAPHAGAADLRGAAGGGVGVSDRRAPRARTRGALLAARRAGGRCRATRFRPQPDSPPRFVLRSARDPSALRCRLAWLARLALLHTADARRLALSRFCNSIFLASRRRARHARARHRRSQSAARRAGATGQSRAVRRRSWATPRPAR